MSSNVFDPNLHIYFIPLLFPDVYINGYDYVIFFVTAYNKKLNYCKQIARPMNRRLNSCMACHLESR